MEEPLTEYAARSQSLQAVKPAWLYLPASQSLQSVVLVLPVSTVVFPPRQFSQASLPGLMLYIPRAQTLQLLIPVLPAVGWNFPAVQSSQPLLPSEYIPVGHLPLQLISSFFTVVKEVEEPAGHSEQECSTVNGVTNGWDMKLPGGQHPIRAFEPDDGT